MAISLTIADNEDIRLTAGGNNAPLTLDAGDTTVVSATDYNELTNKPSINGVELSGNKTTEDLGIEAGVSSFNGQTGDVTYTAPVTSVNGQTGNVIITVPTKTSDLTNDSNYISDVGDTGDLRSLFLLGSSNGATPTTTASTHNSAKVTVSANDSTDGNTILSLGNLIASGTAGAKAGRLRLYGKRYDFYTEIISNPNLTGTHWEVILPAANGTLALTSNIPSAVSQLANDSGFVTSSEVEIAIKEPIFYACDATTKAVLEQGFSVPSTVVTPAGINTMAKFLDYAEPRAWFAWMNGTELEFGQLSMSINTTNSQGTLFIRGRSSVASGTFAASSAWTVTPNPDIPSKTSDLTNDSGYITLADLPIYNGGVS